MAMHGPCMDHCMGLAWTMHGIAWDLSTGCYEILFANVYHSDATLYVNLIIDKYYTDLLEVSFVLFEGFENHTTV